MLGLPTLVFSSDDELQATQYFGHKITRLQTIIYLSTYERLVEEQLLCMMSAYYDVANLKTNEYIATDFIREHYSRKIVSQNRFCTYLILNSHTVATKRNENLHKDY